MNSRPLAAAAVLAAASAALASPAEERSVGDPKAASAKASAPKAAAPARRISFNGKPLGPAQLETLARLEAWHGRIADGAYWYDARSGAAGRWGGPTLAFLPAGLELGGPVPAEASGGGGGLLTGVFVNGREVHPADVIALQELLGVVQRGRWWVDAQGNYGAEGGPALGNLLAIAQQRRALGQRGRHAWSKRLEGAAGGSGLNLASDGTTTCVSASGYSRCTGD